MQLDCSNGKKNKLFSDVSLASFAEKLEIILERVKDLKLFHLIEPIETALMKLRELNGLIDQYTCKQYGDYACPDQDCRKELGFSVSVCKSACPKAAAVESKRPEPPTSESSCACCNSRGERSCHCGSSLGSLAAGRLEPNLHKTETYCIKEPPKCSPCRCPVDASGNGRKSLDCQLAARARRESREAARASGCEARPRTADAKLTTVLDSGLLLLGGTVSQTMIKVEASWPEKTFRFTKEDNVLEQVTERAVLCNMSSESSSEESTRSSSDNACPLLNCQLRGEAPCSAAFNDHRYTDKKSNLCDSDSYLDACGCGQDVAGNACPCGCGDLMELPEKTYEQSCSHNKASLLCYLHTSSWGKSRSHCRCENCGKEIAEGDQEAVTCRAGNRDRRESRQKAASNSPCGKLLEDSHTADIQRYIEELEEQCRKKDKIIVQLQDQLININEGCC